MLAIILQLFSVSSANSIKFIEFSMSNRVALCILLDDWDDDFLEITKNFAPKREKPKELFVKRREEGAFSILIERYLYSDHKLFIEYHRVSPRIFYTILSYIHNDIYVAPTNRVRNPIDPSQKLCIALRYEN